MGYTIFRQTQIYIHWWVFHETAETAMKIQMMNNQLKPRRIFQCDGSSTKSASSLTVTKDDCRQVAEKTKFAVDKGLSTLTCIGALAPRFSRKDDYIFEWGIWPKLLPEASVGLVVFFFGFLSRGNQKTPWVFRKQSFRGVVEDRKSGPICCGTTISGIQPKKTFFRVSKS